MTARRLTTITAATAVLASAVLALFVCWGYAVCADELDASAGER